MYRIMVVEDNIKIRDELCDFLNKNGYETSAIHSFVQPLADIHLDRIDLLLLDLNLPNVDGYYLCREIRKTSTLPIIVVTSRDSQMDELMAMNLGADDFIIKPYHLQILLARIQRVLKRTYEHTNQNTVTINEVSLQILKSTLQFQDKIIELTKNELRIMHCLFQHKNAIVSRNELMQYMWDSDMFIDDNTLTVNINRLRKKLEYISLPDFIKTKRGLGYIIYDDQKLSN